MGLATVLVLVACGDDTPTGLLGIAVVSGIGQVAITVSEDVTPTITWSGGNALRFTITQADGGGVCWDIEALDSAVGFSAPVNFGLVPNTARERSDEVILTAGTKLLRERDPRGRHPGIAGLSRDVLERDHHVVGHHLLSRGRDGRIAHATNPVVALTPAPWPEYVQGRGNSRRGPLEAR